MTTDAAHERTSTDGARRLWGEAAPGRRAGGPPLVLVTTVTHPGGVWRHVVDLGLTLSGRGHDVRVAVPRGARELHADLRRRGLAGHDRAFFPRGAVCHFHAADTYDRVLMRRMLASRVSGCRVVVTEHLPRTDASDSSLTDDPHRRLAWSVKTLQKVLQGRIVDATVVVSESSARFLALRYGGRRGDFDVVRNGVDHPDDAGTSPVQDTGAVVGAAGAMLRQKGFDTLLRAVAASTGGWRLVLAGTGPHAEAYTTLARDLGIEDRVTFLGWQESAREVFRESRVVAIPSRWEAAPYVVLEAMSEGRPVVATRFDGVDEVVLDGETGRLVPVDDVAGLAAVLDEVVLDTAGAARMGTAGRDRVLEHDEFSTAGMVDRLVGVYERVSRW